VQMAAKHVEWGWSCPGSTRAGGEATSRNSTKQMQSGVTGTVEEPGSMDLKCRGVPSSNGKGQPKGCQGKGTPGNQQTGRSGTASRHQGEEQAAHSQQSSSPLSRGEGKTGKHLSSGHRAAGGKALPGIRGGRRTAMVQVSHSSSIQHNVPFLGKDKNI
jgi:hypothetical protein